MVALDPEQEFINHLAVKESAEEILKEGVSETLLINLDSKRIYQYVRTYVNQSNSLPTPDVLVTEFGDRFTEPKSSVDWTIEQLKHRYQRTEVYELANFLADNMNDPSLALKALRDKVVEIDNNTLSHKNIWNLKEDWKMFVGDWQDHIINGNGKKRFSLGFPEIDAHTGGLRPGQLAVIAARPKRMKTFIMLVTFIEQIKQGHNPIFFTLELTHEEVMKRIACLITGVSWDDVQKDNLSKKDWDDLNNGMENFMEYYDCEPHVIQPKPNERTVGQLVTMADKLKADSIFISQLKHIRSATSFKNSFDSYNDIVLELKWAAMKPDNNRPVILEAQLNREAQNVKELQDMDLAQFGLSDALGQTSDLLMGIASTKDKIKNGLIEYGIIESRNCAHNSWLISGEFKKATQYKLIGEAHP